MVLPLSIRQVGYEVMTEDVGGIAADRLRSIIERIERLEEEKKAIAGDIKEIYAEAKGTGFDTRIIRKLVQMRKKNVSALREEEELMDLYRQALGMIV
ncbi:MAG: hypothetical protein FD153_1808 [Rhodospirillaceae bacterium]|nr:MAG: hypothetical protein FD153_1808 [Rhodospirillaceae bacterium]